MVGYGCGGLDARVVLVYRPGGLSMFHPNLLRRNTHPGLSFASYDPCSSDCLGWLTVLSNDDDNPFPEMESDADCVELS